MYQYDLYWVLHVSTFYLIYFIDQIKKNKENTGSVSHNILDYTMTFGHCYNTGRITKKMQCWSVLY